MSGVVLLQWLVAAAYLLAAGLLAVRDRQPQLGRVAVGLACAGVLLHMAILLARGVTSGQIPIVTRYEDFTVDALFIALVWLLAQWRWPSLRPTGMAVLPFAAFVVMAALTYSLGVFPMSPALRTNWLIIHASLNSLAVGFATLTLVAGWWLRGGSQTERVGRLMSWTFFFWCAMVAAGSYWASIAWGRFWAWDPIECWSLGTIFAYAFALHLRMRPQWREGFRSLLIGLPPFALLMFTTYGLVFVMRSVHGQYLFQ